MPPKPSSKARLMINLFDGRREPFPADDNILIRLFNGYQEPLKPRNVRHASILFSNLETFDNFGDNYTVLASAANHVDAGFTPVKIKRGIVQHLDLMLLPKDGTFNFSDARWAALSSSHPRLIELFSAGASSSSSARARYEELLEEKSANLACLFNLVTAMAGIRLQVGSPVDYLKQLIWEEIREDRFFAWADVKLLEQIERAAVSELFSPEVGSALFHPGATKSFKQVEFGDANVQLTFHETDKKRIDGVECLKVEPDIDYHKDLAAHTLLEVIPNSFSGSLSDPRQVYVLRWIVGRRAGLQEFNPPYTIV